MLLDVDIQIPLMLFVINLSLFDAYSMKNTFFFQKLLVWSETLHCRGLILADVIAFLSTQLFRTELRTLMKFYHHSPAIFDLGHL
jgi:hypothetical protein